MKKPTTIRIITTATATPTPTPAFAPFESPVSESVCVADAGCVGNVVAVEEGYMVLEALAGYSVAMIRGV